MATVIHVPKDTRFGVIGAGLGAVAKGFTDKKAEEEKKAKRAAQLEEVFQAIDDPTREVNRSGLINILSEFEIDEAIQISNSVMTRRDQIRDIELKELFRKGQLEHEKGLSEAEIDARKEQGRLTRKTQIDISKLQIGSREGLAKKQRKLTEDLAEEQRKLSRELATEDRKFKASQTDSDQQFRADQAEAGRFHTEKLAGLPFAVSKEQGAFLAKISGLPNDLAKGDFGSAISKIAADTNLSASLKTNLIGTFVTGITAQQRIKAAGERDKTKENRTKVTLPDGSVRDIIADPGETFQEAVDKLIANGQLPQGSRLGTFTEGQRDVKSVMELNNLDPENPEHLARATRFVKVEGEVRRAIASKFGIQRDEEGFFVSLTGNDKSALVREELAGEAVQDIMLAGDGTTDIGKASAEAVRLGEEAYRKREWVPAIIRETKQPKHILDYAKNIKNYEQEDIKKLGELLGMPPEAIKLYIDVTFLGMTLEQAQGAK